MIGLKVRDGLPQWALDAFDLLVAGIRGVIFAEHNADGTHGLIHTLLGIMERGRAFLLGEFVQVPFAPTNFVAVGGGNTWTVASGNVITNEYTIVGKKVTYIFSIANSTTAGAPTDLEMTLPPGMIVNKDARNVMQVRTGGGVLQFGLVYARPPSGLNLGNKLIFYVDATMAASWGAGATVGALGQIQFEMK